MSRRKKRRPGLMKRALLITLGIALAAVVLFYGYLLITAYI